MKLPPRETPQNRTINVRIVRIISTTQVVYCCDQYVPLTCKPKGGK